MTDTKEQGDAAQFVRFGATYSTEAHNFGTITSIFVVDDDWDGYRFHGYCRPSVDEVARFGY